MGDDLHTCKPPHAANSLPSQPQRHNRHIYIAVTVTMDPLLLVALAVVAVTALLLFLRGKSAVSLSSAVEPDALAAAGRAQKRREEEEAVAAAARKKAKKADKAGGGKKPGPHPLLVASLKGHTKAVLHIAFTPDERFLASCSEDRTMRLWDTKGFADKVHPYIRVNVELDHPICVAFSMDSKYDLG